MKNETGSTIRTDEFACLRCKTYPNTYEENRDNKRGKSRQKRVQEAAAIEKILTHNLVFLSQCKLITLFVQILLNRQLNIN